MTPLRHPVSLLAMAALLCAAAPSDTERRATPPPAPRPARPSGEVLFSDAFSDSTIAPWTSDRAGVWSIRRGVLCGDMPDGKQLHSFLMGGDSTWTDYAVDLDVCQMRGVDKGVAVRVEGRQGIGVDLRGPGYHDVLLHRAEWPIGRARVVNGNGVWHHLRVEAQFQRYRVFVDGELVIEREDSRRSRSRGRITLPAYTGGVGQCTVYYDNVLVTALK